MALLHPCLEPQERTSLLAIHSPPPDLTYPIL